ncbi:uncharacterized protein LOC110450154 [Mizuhopecten yessoensis]|uniref:uncharacterized protein LOC110450154 n=1 Tax=Mizuhopecten yessoensis TaxID=6573 RepID=UPI000B45A4EF|nr:uncharacterized protein LOC110450154 [Mizuhopecten yessoensis]
MNDPSMVLIPPVHELISGVLYFYVPNSLDFWLVFVTDANIVKIDGKHYNLTAVDNIPDFFKGILQISSGIHNISLPNHALRLTGYIHGRKRTRAMSYPLTQHKHDSCDNVATQFPQGGCERHATAGTSTVNLPIETTSSTLETVTPPPGTSVSVARTTTSQELTSTYKEVTSVEMITSSVGMTSLSRAFEKITTSPLRHSTVSSIQTCSCLQRNCSLNPNEGEMKRIIEALRTELLIQREKTNRYKRSLTSAWDGRTSAKVLGYGASIILGAVGIGIVILDLNNLIRYDSVCFEKRRFASHTGEQQNSVESQYS